MAAKVLSAVETVGKYSNQHELDGVQSLRELFGTPEDKMRIPTRFLWMSDDADEPVDEDGRLTFYDARANHPTRSEYRLYYPASVNAMKMAQPGDVVFIARQRTGDALFIVAPGDSSIAAQLDWLFGTSVAEHRGFSIRADLNEPREGSAEGNNLGLPALYLLDLLGIAVEPAKTSDAENWLEKLLAKFGERFPTSAEFGAFTRSTLPDLHPADDPDAVLMAWLEQEEILFRVLERHLATDTLDALYVDGHVDVDRFIEVSLSMHNRRKSRAGKGLENQLIALFNALDVRHSFNPVTENRTRPDFIFPGINEYVDGDFPALNLTMLGVKTTCKDRWRQVLSEAQRIEDKHLLTLETPISPAQTDEMREWRLQLVVPAALHAPYNPAQQQWLMSIADLVAMARERDCRGPAQAVLL
ncbi:type II restriction endonuclease (plasmid) [Arthrobacter agilis]|uniref:type II restriction endonuclease n=1 Tax=Arthrobacter agilis TaxID=37921 RepID=UPI0023657993|nr:type II restriction endonuclease [Arthrobacter agilis]WDF35073.1 type II restriction endonuclease [Arthrobacter agilis]